MTLHDIAEGLPTDLEQLLEAANRIYKIYGCFVNSDHLKTLEANQ